MKSTHALLIIDMQLVAFDGKIIPPISNGTQLLESVFKLTTVCRRNDVHIIYVQTSAVSGQPYAEDVHGWEIHPKLAPQDGDHVIGKRNSSGFDDTDLRVVLDQLGVNSVITSGIWSEFCVANTSIDAAKIGFDVFVAADAHGTVSSSKEAANEIVEQQNDRLAEINISVLETNELEHYLSGC
ncbi:MAG: cysteine hydrolase [Gammaproteobacteria bacterium]|nr:cysteine hydrolase [Gammaproteobacteria bacterium]